MPAVGRVLVCDQDVPAHDRDAGGLRMTWIIQQLKELGCAVTLFPLDRARREPYASDLAALGIEVHCGRESVLDLARSRPDGYDLVILSRPEVARALLDDIRQGFPRAIVTYDTVDLHFLRDRRWMKLKKKKKPSVLDVLRLYRRQVRELRLVRRTDFTIAVTEAEAEIIRRFVPKARIVILPTVHPMEAPPPGLEGREGLLFIGGFNHAPNVDAMTFFTEEILPVVRRRVCARLYIVGSNPTNEILRLRSRDVVVTGHVPDPGPFFRRARVFVSPLRFGAGMKGKNGQAMAFGLPMVTTSIGAEGMELVDRREALIRDDPNAFADAVVELYESPRLWESISLNAQAHAQRRWTPEAMQVRLQHFLASLQPRNLLDAPLGRRAG